LIVYDETLTNCYYTGNGFYYSPWNKEIACSVYSNTPRNPFLSTYLWITGQNMEHLGPINHKRNPYGLMKDIDFIPLQIIESWPGRNNLEKIIIESNYFLGTPILVKIFAKLNFSTETIGYSFSFDPQFTYNTIIDDMTRRSAPQNIFMRYLTNEIQSPSPLYLSYYPHLQDLAFNPKHWHTEIPWGFEIERFLRNECQSYPYNTFPIPSGIEVYCPTGNYPIRTWMDLAIAVMLIKKQPRSVTQR